MIFLFLTLELTQKICALINFMKARNQIMDADFVAMSHVHVMPNQIVVDFSRHLKRSFSSLN